MSEWPSPRIVYSPHYNIGFFGLERLHPFDSRKYGRAWKEVRRQMGPSVKRFQIAPPRAIRPSELLEVHSKEYLARLRDRRFLADVLEVPQLKRVPARATEWLVLRPMRWATMGTIVAACAALEHGLVINLSGGYHHASPEQGHGFSAYADVGLAIHDLRKTGQLRPADKVAYVDLDAHQGNGVCRTFFDDKRVFIYDQYNREIFPHDLKAQRRIDCDVPVVSGCRDADYLGALQHHLPSFLDGISRGGEVRLAIYNAGTDIFREDALGGMNVSAEGVQQRDQFVLKELMRRHIPSIVLLSGGYSAESYRLVAQMIINVLEKWGSPVKDPDQSSKADRGS
jgi:histone deacetylase 11